VNTSWSDWHPLIGQETGVKGYICPTCSREYDPLYVSHLFDPSQGTFTCEDDKTELIDHDPAAMSVGGQEKMQAFNISTQPIRDSLKRLEGLTLPSLNIMAWIAQNVVTEVVGVDGTEGDNKKVTVVIGGEEKDQLEKERLQEAQRYVASAESTLTFRVQNALPVWHTHSTVTGSATTLGIANQARQQAHQARGYKAGDQGHAGDEDDLLEAHYANLQGDEEEDIIEETVPVISQAPSTAPPSDSMASTPGEGVMVMGRS
jgi:transcription initiation factor TFIIE subunit alpha